MDKLTAQQRHKCMSRIKSKDTSIELTLRRALWHKGIRYRKNFKALPGSPDIVITKYKVAVFCDGEFFHGKDFEENLRGRLSQSDNSSYWIGKIEKNIHRDNDVDRQLRSLGFYVLRFWGREIKKDTDGCVKAVEEAIFEQRMRELEGQE